MITIDASVFISAALPDEADSEVSVRFLETVAQRGIPVACPTLLIPEVAAAIARRKDDTAAAAEFAENLPALFPFSWVDLDSETAQEAARLAAEHRLRGADAVYAAAAKAHEAILVTLDREQLARARAVIDTQTPADFLRKPPIGGSTTRGRKPGR